MAMPNSTQTKVEMITNTRGIPTSHTLQLHEDIVMVEMCMYMSCLLYTSPSPRDATLSRMPSSA